MEQIEKTIQTEIGQFSVKINNPTSIYTPFTFKIRGKEITGRTHFDKNPENGKWDLKHEQFKIVRWAGRNNSKLDLYVLHSAIFGSNVTTENQRIAIYENVRLHVNKFFESEEGVGMLKVVSRNLLIEKLSDSEAELIAHQAKGLELYKQIKQIKLDLTKV